MTEATHSTSRRAMLGMIAVAPLITTVPSAPANAALAVHNPEKARATTLTELRARLRASLPPRPPYTEAEVAADLGKQVDMLNWMREQWLVYQREVWRNLL